MNNNPFNDKIRQIAQLAAAENGVEFIHSEVLGSKKSFTVKVYIDKPGGVTVEDCSVVSRKIDAALDADDFIPAAYILEVSSPGIERELYSLQDFIKFNGSAAKIRTHKPIGAQRNFRGAISGIEGEEIIFDDKTSGILKIPFAEIAKANLEVDLNEELKNSGKR